MKKRGTDSLRFINITNSNYYDKESDMDLQIEKCTIEVMIKIDYSIG